MPSSFSLYQINNADSFDFRPEEYSRFKFGDDLVARKYGTALAEAFIAGHLSLQPAGRQLVVISSPYSFIPTATFAMKNHFVYRLNRWLSEHDHPVVHETKVHRSITYKEDYGELDAEARLRLIGNDEFHIDKEFLEGKTLVFLDDIRITGSHEKMILRMVDEFGLLNDIHLLYFAELTNKSIHPNIENYLNYHSVKSIFDLEDIVKSGYFFINTRIVKYILNSEFNSFRIFIQNQTDEFINHLYNMALGNNYHNITAYSQNLNHIREYIKNFNLKQLQNGN
jgi:hypothetical protein